MEEELQQCLPPRVLEDYEDYCVGLSPYRKMMNGIENVPMLKKLFFSTNKFVLNILNLKLKSEWIKELG